MSNSSRGMFTDSMMTNTATRNMLDACPNPHSRPTGAGNAG